MNNLYKNYKIDETLTTPIKKKKQYNNVKNFVQRRKTKFSTPIYK